MRNIPLPLIVILFLSASFSFADDGVLFKSQREFLASKGLTFDPYVIEDYASIYKGGLIDNNTWLGRFDFVSEFDLEKAGLLKGGLVHLDVLNAHGGLKPTTDHMVGDLQIVSDIEATRSSRIYEGWYSQSFFDNKLSIKFGIVDLGSEFLVSDSGNLYINSSLNLLPSMWFNNYSDAVYPEPVPAVRFKYSPNEHFDFLAGLFQGNPLNSDINAHSTHFGDGEGLLSIEEGQYHYKLPIAEGLAGTFKGGFWYNSKDVQDVSSLDSSGNPLLYDDNYGAYAMIDQRVFQVNESQGLNVFFFGGGAPEDRNTIQDSFAGGLNYTGLIPCRPKDVTGVALTNAAISNKLRAVTGQDKDETTYEWTYQIKIKDNIFLQPDIQYVQHPNGNNAIKNASVFMLRTEIHF
ncbi:MAG: carbohydrate porin [Candidatus Omnitrophica bacterium]|nr:carbohydrate porin [Candidatus Omnitrophota bacterium]